MFYGNVWGKHKRIENVGSKHCLKIVKIQPKHELHSELNSKSNKVKNHKCRNSFKIQETHASEVNTEHSRPLSLCFENKLVFMKQVRNLEFTVI